MASESPMAGRRPSLAQALVAAVTFVPRAWTRAPLALALLALTLSIPAIIGAAGPGLLALVSLAQVAALLVAGEALLRLGLGLAPAGLGGLAPGRLALRLLASALLCGLFLALIAVVLALLLAGTFGAAGLEQAEMAALRPSAGMPAWKTALLIGLSVAAVAVLLVLWTRLSLAWPATAARGRVVSLEALRLSRGRTIALLAGLVVTSAPLIGLIAWFVAGAPETGMTDAVWALVLALLQVPLTLGFLSAAYGGAAGEPRGESDEP